MPENNPVPQWPTKYAEADYLWRVAATPRSTVVVHEEEPGIGRVLWRAGGPL